MRAKALVLPAGTAIVIAVIALALGHHRAQPSVRQSGGVLHGTAVSIKIHDFAYSPDELAVRAGTRITVANADQTEHTLTARSGAFDTGTIQPGRSMSFTVTKPGSYPFYCQFHAFMTGMLKVVK